MKRRNFIIISAAGATAITASSLYFYFGNQEERLLARPKSLSMIWDEGSIYDLGEKYLLQFPEEKDKKLLLSKLCATPPKKMKDLALLLEQKIKQDFESGNTIMIDGWILSATEARQCALFSINN